MLDTSTNSLLCGFAFAFDRHAKSFTIDCDACSSGRSAGTSVLLKFELITNLFDPWEIMTQDWELSFLISIPVCRTDDWSSFPIRVQFLCFPESIHLVVMIRHFLEECIHDKLLKRIVLLQRNFCLVHQYIRLPRSILMGQILHTCLQLFREDWADWQKQSCEKQSHLLDNPQ